MDRKKVSSKKTREVAAVGFAPMRKLLFGATQQTGLRRGECEKTKGNIDWLGFRGGKK